MSRGTIDNDFAVDPQEAMRGVCIFFVLDFHTLLSGKRWRRRREQRRQDDHALSYFLHHADRTSAAFVSPAGGRL